MERKTQSHYAPTPGMAQLQSPVDKVAQQQQPMELEHLIGYTGQNLNTVKCHTQENQSLLYSVGDVVVLADDSNPHNQRFFRGHDATVCCFAVSPCGKLVASGQIGSKRYKGHMAPVIVYAWNGKVLGQFSGLTDSVITLDFSPDSRFLAASGANNMFYIWDLESGDVLVAQRSEKPISTVAWGPMSRGKSRRNPTYSLVTCPSPVVRYHILEFETKSMQYVLKTYKCQFPSRGLVRSYTSAVFDDLGESVMAGTEEGDLLVFNMRSTIFRTRIPICSKGISSIVRGKEGNDVLYLGGGDGTVQKLKGRDREWSILAESKLPGTIVSLTLSAKGDKLFAGVAQGAIYVINESDFQFKLHSESHIETINDVSFGGQDPALFCTISEDRMLRVWDLSRYTTLLTVKGLCAGRICVLDDVKGEIVTGWADGSIRSFRLKDGKEMWSIFRAHKGAITCLDLGGGNLLSGGQDGSVRVWQTPSGRLITQYQAHKGPVREVLADVVQPSFIHSCGKSDRSITTYNAKRNQHVISHMIQNGAFTSMVQRKDSEQELITGLSHGYILFWDCDETNPVGNVLDSGRSKISCLALSPDGKYLAASGVDYRLRVYDIKTMNVIARCSGHAAPVSRIMFSPDQKQIVSVGADSAICVW
eukprot:CAMPEP_0197522748 /NCGR_PEP_ID=MMETSP1318-20131121/7827_1 /TAXON_ID=552666 /ORGANISM="Partenskyella glossopodia, Strain RCC365" /LENGTH=645 /DNA_ID=CAMNT_0043075215 /DNA_START=241 /DNA_END=2175 /DNA_ORIENTATION=+